LRRGVGSGLYGCNSCQGASVAVVENRVEGRIETHIVNRDDARRWARGIEAAETC
jgi:hypothetical protein